MTAATTPPELIATLDSIVQRSRRRVRSRRVRAAVVAALPSSFALLMVVPLVALGVELVRTVAGGSAVLPAVPALVVATLAVPALRLVAVAVTTALREIDRRDALGAVDQLLDLEDRLLAADEFARTGHTSAFAAAAIEDAREHADRALAAELALPPIAPAALGRRPLWGIAAGVAMLIVAGWLGTLTWTAAADEITGEPTADVVAVAETVRRPAPTARTPGPEPVPPPQREPAPGSDAPMAVVSETPPSADHTADQKESAGRTEQGQPSVASASRGASNARGSASNRGPVAKTPTRKPVVTPAKRRPPDQRRPDQEPPETEQKSGATPGRGSARGSSRNPAVSDWSSRDHVASPEDEKSEEEEDIQDEDEEQKSRGGIQPNLRDRKPPVNRDLRIGFGNRKNPDANGRGGPSEMKKSRGVASLVLGIPIPDRIKGQPNPGRTKVTQERIRPVGETAPPIAAAARTPRSAPPGYVTQRVLSPAMRDLVRRYFLTLRTKTIDDR